jgi:hypothetical protein
MAMIQRKTPLKRSGKPLKRAPVKKRRTGKPRRGPNGIPAEEWRNPGYLDYLRVMGTCVVCPSLKLSNFCDPCHGPVNGMRSKGPDAGAIPMCRYHHEEQTRIGWDEFERVYGFERAFAASVWWIEYQAWKG